MAGIHAFGGYVPRLRLKLASAFEATGWFAPNLKNLAKGERSFCSWDEDVVTMAVEAARDSLASRDRSSLARVMLASTSHTFSDRQNSTIVKEALNLADATAALDVAGSKRSGTSALIDAFHAVRGGAGDTLVVAAERGRAMPGSETEFTSGHGAGAMLVSTGDGCAKFIGSHSVTIDFVDHFRKEGEAFDYAWEARWVREEGFGKIVVSAIDEACRRFDVDPRSIDHFVLGSPMPGIAAYIAKRAGIRGEAVADSLAGRLGDAGAAQPLILLSHVLEQADRNQLIMMVGFGGGCDVVLLRTTDAIARTAPVRGVGGYLADRAPVDNYVKYLSFSGLLRLEAGMRAELDQKPILTAQYRQRRSVLGLVGGRCTQSGVVQFPKTPVSVARDVRAIHTQEDYPMAELPARLFTFTTDYLMYSPAPPVNYGNIEFDGGGRMLAEIVDAETDELEVGMRLRMVFRVKAIDEQRGFSQYFWKAAPVRRKLDEAKRKEG